jgi:bifunctional non-homologous end joining protein LigD
LYVGQQVFTARRQRLLMRKDGAERHTAYAPMLAVPGTSLPPGPDWVFEPKWDGFRAIVRLSAGAATLTSRNGNDLTGRFAGLALRLPAAIAAAEVVLDGEVCVLDELGRSTFGALQQGKEPIFVAFDLLEKDGVPLVESPLESRRGLLERLIVGSDGAVLLSPQVADGVALLAATCGDRRPSSADGRPDPGNAPRVSAR